MGLARRAVKTGGWHPRASDAVDLGTGPGMCTSTELPGSYLPLPSTAVTFSKEPFSVFQLLLQTLPCHRVIIHLFTYVSLSNTPATTS